MSSPILTNVPSRNWHIPEVAIGENQYIPLAPSYDDGTIPGTLRVLAGGHVDLKASFTDHNAYVEQITSLTRELQAQGYLLKADADAIIRAAMESDIGNPRQN